ncbi:response regulator transcription factor [Streptomyces sp. NPDC046197]|uniref:response regulator transcription factor n=1 Tax=Streptomyces sp. NPDC046197 TaxID=3154337 RepID=UPI0033EC14B7
MNEPIRVLIVEDRAIARTGIRAVLDEDRGIEVVGEVSDGASVLSRTRELQPHLLLVGALPHTLNTVELVGALAPHPGGRRPGVLLMAGEADNRARRAFRAGVKGVILSRSTPGQLLSAVHVVAAGYRIFFDESVSSEGDDTMVPGTPPTTRHDAHAANVTGLSTLTPREKDVFRLLAHGLSNTEISVALVLSENTVKSHVQRLLEKLNLRNRVHAVIHAYRTGLMTSGPDPAPQGAEDCLACGAKAGESA